MYDKKLVKICDYDSVTCISHDMDDTDRDQVKAFHLLVSSLADNHSERSWFFVF